MTHATVPLRRQAPVWEAVRDIAATAAITLTAVLALYADYLHRAINAWRDWQNSFGFGASAWDVGYVEPGIVDPLMGYVTAAVWLLGVTLVLLRGRLR